MVCRLSCNMLAVTECTIWSRANIALPMGTQYIYSSRSHIGETNKCIYLIEKLQALTDVRLL
jgi:hypothetical protein